MSLQVLVADAPRIDGDGRIGKTTHRRSPKPEQLASSFLVLENEHCEEGAAGPVRASSARHA
ncbi:hypothetical protein HY29_08625 [Hyphomonas beringensis]|uniref:Uncharacterized protein n=1 Tax=Hyphomonas beringensis TaxID=1280946 RepID=A0A062U7L2_9PROT|nr:hypothetical protein HY29_08625 [Hyphomonas beringensis]